MSDYFTGEIKMFPYTFNPRGWAYCNGQLMSISQNTALFSIIGTIYGGDGRTTMGLPNLEGHTPMHQGQGPGLTPKDLGTRGGWPSGQLNEANLPTHNHSLNTVQSPREASTPAPNNTLGGTITGPGKVYNQGASADGNPMAVNTVAMSGSNARITNRQPYLAIPFYICLVGIYPARN